MGYILRVHGDGFTVDHPHESDAEAEMHAIDLVASGIVRLGNKIYPTRHIVAMEILEKEQKSGA